MKYNEKLKYIEEALVHIVQGESFGKRTRILAAKGLMQYEIKQVMSSIEKELLVKYRQNMVRCIKNNLIERKTSFSNLADDVFEFIKEKVTLDLVRLQKLRMRELYSKGKNHLEIMADVVKPYFGEQAANDFLLGLDSEKQFNKTPKSILKASYLIVASVAIGVITLFFYEDFSSHASRLNGTKISITLPLMLAYFIAKNKNWAKFIFVILFLFGMVLFIYVGGFQLIARMDPILSVAMIGQILTQSAAAIAIIGAGAKSW